MTYRRLVLQWARQAHEHYRFTKQNQNVSRILYKPQRLRNIKPNHQARYPQTELVNRRTCREERGRGDANRVLSHPPAQSESVVNYFCISTIRCCRLTIADCKASHLDNGAINHAFIAISCACIGSCDGSVYFFQEKPEVADCKASHVDNGARNYAFIVI